MTFCGESAFAVGKADMAFAAHSPLLTQSGQISRIISAAPSADAFGEGSTVEQYFGFGASHRSAFLLISTDMETNLSNNLFGVVLRGIVSKVPAEPDAILVGLHHHFVRI